MAAGAGSMRRASSVHRASLQCRAAALGELGQIVLEARRDPAAAGLNAGAMGRDVLGAGVTQHGSAILGERRLGRAGPPERQFFARRIGTRLIRIPGSD